MSRIAAAGLLTILFSLAHPAGGATGLTAGDLHCEYHDKPLTIDTPHPRLSWKLASDQNGAAQTGYQILVASTPPLLSGDMWDSGKVASSESIQIPYDGKPLESGQIYYWKVRVWDKEGRASPWSKSASWSMGVLAPADWTAQWIRQAAGPTTRPMPMFRTQFNVAKPLKRAVIYICGLGQFQLFVNGHAAGQDILDPGWTDYRKTCLYVGHDLTGQLEQGPNALGVMLGTGMYAVPPQRYHKFTSNSGPLMVIAQLQLEFTDGTRQTIATGPSWKVSSGPITFSSIYGGEDYDGRLDQPGWNAVGFNDASWESAVSTPGPGGVLAGASHSAPPIQVIQWLAPVALRQIKPGVRVYDLGQNCAMTPSITVAGKPGQYLKLTPGELLNPDGSVSQGNSGKGCYYMYICGPDIQHTWRPQFAYYGARYLQVEGDATLLDLHGRFISSISKPVGRFRSSSELFNRTAGLIRWAMRSNLMSVITDCPHREKLGWLEQDHLMGPSLMYNFEIASLLNKVCWDMADAQHNNGLIPDIAPEYVAFKTGFLDSPEWGSAAVLLPWNLYRWYGDRAALEIHYDMMRRYVAYLDSTATGGIVNHGLGDWYDLGEKGPGIAQLTPIALTATAFYYRDLIILEKTAQVLGHDDDAIAYAHAAGTVKDAFNAAFYDAAQHRYASGSQTADAIPLVFGLTPPSDSQGVLKDLIDDVRRHNNGLTAGDVGYRYVLRALADGGRSDVIYDMNCRSDRPGYGWQLDHGATSLTEAWDANPRRSQDHFMLGHIMEWFYADLAGIQQSENSLAFNHVLIKPAMTIPQISSAQATYDSIRGPISSSWQRIGEAITLELSIPPGSDAQVYLPPQVTAPPDEPGEKLLRMDGGQAVLAVESGHYKLVCHERNP